MMPRCVRGWGILAAFLAVYLGVPSAVQAVQQDERVQLASREEGEIIVQAAWELRRGLTPKPDCSHFVNAVYAQAGLDYEYANSNDIFDGDGVDSFQRVQTPQPGDLVVWHGHIGIVVDPKEHSFYSSVLSGFAIEDYRSDYWTSRGRPRFYRYRVDQVHRAHLVAHVNARQTALDHQISSPAGGSTSDHDATRRDGADNEFTAASTSGKLAANNTEILDSVFVSPRPKPSKEEVRTAIVRASGMNSERLLRIIEAGSHSNITLVDDFTVVEINVRDRSGWADVDVKETEPVQNAKTEFKQIRERWRLPLRREQQGWVLLSLQDRMYLRRDQAVKALANRLALMSEEQGNLQELRKTVRMLDELLGEKTAKAPATGSQ